MKNSYYFPHDYHARHDPKLEVLRMELGPVSDGIFWDLVEMLYEENGYLLIKDIPLYAKMLNTDEHMLNKVVNTLFLKDENRFYNQSLLDRLEHLNDVIYKRQIAGKASGKARQKNTCSTSDEQVSNIRDREIKKRDRIKIPPTIEELTTYCKERKNSVNPDSFLNHYASKGWMIGKNKMVDWKAAVRTWEKNSEPKGFQKP